MTARREEPADLPQAAECVRRAAREGARIVPAGFGSKRAWTRPVPHEVELGTRALSGIVDHQPGDGTITALAGTPWGELARAARAHGHHLTPAIPDEDRATLGGVLAAAQSGFDRLRFGPVRHHVLGVRVLQADGTIAKSGGRLVKNVTGFDLQRLHTGAHGTLGVVVEASLRLHALPESWAVASAARLSWPAALELARAALAPPHSPWAVAAHDLGPGAPGEFALAVVLAGRADVVPGAARTLAAACPGIELQCPAPGTPEAQRVAELADALRELERASGGWPHVRLGCLPGDLARVAAALADCAREARSELRVLAHPGIATLDAWLRPLDAPLARAISAAARAAGAQVHWRGLPDELRGTVDPFGAAEPHGLALMRRLQSALDPAGLFARGRLAGGL